jgi:hypothetical protein
VADEGCRCVDKDTERDDGSQRKVGKIDIRSACNTVPAQQGNEAAGFVIRLEICLAKQI